ncbi:spore coat U domain-containing protein [Sphingomonas sp. Y38-1Y]|uniref:Csu type fimbrial protein n=1 Tax=Sphingomonas sp. Y38-1Y TaxID=3078265 RepID=UPI0028E693C8|nr:spore coat U domain-containing protein [Sphingomonas sp. Y38-1Y]
MKRLLVALLLFCGVLAIPSPASAQTCSATISTIDFGSPSLISGGPLDVTGTVTVTCTSIPLLSVVKVCPGIGAGSGGTDGSGRLMAGPSGSLRYQLYQDTARSVAWGSLDNPVLGTVPAIIVSGSLNGAGSATRILYARLFGGQTSAVPGSYQSNFAGNATNFSYGAQLLGASNSCTGFAGAASIRPTFSVLAAPPKGCTIAATPLTFPTAGVLSRAVTAQSQLSVACTNQTAYALQLDAGRNADAAGGRRMRGPSGGFISYGLFRDAALASAWSAGAQQSGMGLGTTQQMTIYGRVPVQTTPSPGLYSDTVVATVTY